MPRNRAPNLTRADVAKKEAEKKEALADRDDTSSDNLHKALVDFLLNVVQDVCLLHGLAKEQAESSSLKAPWQTERIMTLKQCEEIICNELEEWSCDMYHQEHYYNEPALLLHKKMWNIMLRCPPHK